MSVGRRGDRAVLGTPSRTGPTHVMQLRPVRVGDRGAQVLDDFDYLPQQPAQPGSAVSCWNGRLFSDCQHDIAHRTLRLIRRMSVARRAAEFCEVDHIAGRHQCLDSVRKRPLAAGL